MQKHTSDPLSDFKCVACGHSENADINAAKNILASGHGVLACGAASLEPAVKQEPVILSDQITLL